MKQILSPIEAAIADERRRVVQLLKAHEGWIGEMLFSRLVNMVQNGTDLEDEMAVPIEDRIPFFDWPDAPHAKTRRKKAKPKSKK